MVMAMTGPTISRAHDRGLDGRQPLLDMAVDVFDHHDGIVDDGPMASTMASRVSDSG
jgi:hypothetical protein